MTDSSTAAARRTVPGTGASELELLRAYEPVFAFTQGEMFFPMDVEAYLADCSLTVKADRGPGKTIVGPGDLSLERLADIGLSRSTRDLALKYVQEPLTGAEPGRWDAARPRFSRRGRVARVGLIGRFADAATRLSSLLRRRGERASVARAQTQYAERQADGVRFTYYGRVLRRSGYAVLSYHFFYGMNDWRTSFFGASDHEADWEQVIVFLVESLDGSLTPAWLACSMHDRKGADLRRRWDDPALTFDQDHPVVFVGAGSHACYFEEGEYVVPAPLTAPGPLGAIVRWAGRLRPGINVEAAPASARHIVSVPFIDYARGDGARIGAGQSGGWLPRVIDDTVDWVAGYRGTWGSDGLDAFYDERAPAGPKFERDGSVRLSWFDPLAWCDLDREPAPGETDADLAEHLEYLRREANDIADRVARYRDWLPRLWLETQALRGNDSLEHLLNRRLDQISRLEGEMLELEREEEDLRGAILACEKQRSRSGEGYLSGPRDHLAHPASPEPPGAFRETRTRELRAVIVAGLLVLAGALLIETGAPWFVAVLLLVAGCVLVDALLKGSLVRLLLSLTVFVAALATAVLVYFLFWWLVLVAFGLIALLILGNRLRS